MSQTNSQHTHILGGTQALLAALFLQLQPNSPVAGLYTYGQPVAGTTAFNEYATQCIGPQKYIRVTSSNDVAPFIKSDDLHKHPVNAKEIYAPFPQKPIWKQDCVGNEDPRCSSGVPCAKKSWENHSLYAAWTMSHNASCVL